jgi:hemerythrin-like metal-binding protein
MKKLEWNASLELGVAAMDREHRQLIEAMDRVCKLDEQGAGKVQLDQALQQLVSITKKHFADEERYMESIDYPDRRRHALIHVDMLEKIGKHYEAFQAGDGGLPEGFMSFLVHWLGAHIKGIDKKYAQHPVVS